MDRFKYERVGPSIREIKSRRALSIIEKAVVPVRPVVVMDPRYRHSRIVSARNEMKVQKSKSFLEISDIKENFMPIREKVLESENLSFLKDPEPKSIIPAPRTIPLTQNKFALDLEKMEERLSSFYTTKIL